MNSINWNIDDKEVSRINRSSSLSDVVAIRLVMFQGPACLPAVNICTGNETRYDLASE
jgi:hypothetical protein